MCLLASDHKFITSESDSQSHRYPVREVIGTDLHFATIIYYNGRKPAAQLHYYAPR